MVIRHWLGGRGVFQAFADQVANAEAVRVGIIEQNQPGPLDGLRVLIQVNEDAPEN